MPAVSWDAMMISNVSKPVACRERRSAGEHHEREDAGRRDRTARADEQGRR